MFDRLRLPDVMGRPTRGEVCGPYIYPIVAAIFGSINPETYERFIREFFLMIPKGNDKTGTAATISVLWNLMNKKPEAELVIIAPSKKIADRSFEYAAGIIRADTDLEKVFFPPRSHTRRIEHRLRGSSISVVAADTNATTGSKQTVTLIDELHELSLSSQASAIMTELRGALGKNRDGFMLSITTQSKKPPVGIFKDELEKARDVRDGKIRLPMLPILYELPPALSKEGLWKNRAYWPLVNPNLNRSIQLSYLEEQVTVAERQGKPQLALIASQHFNVQIGVGQSTDGWSGALHWEAASDPALARDAIMAANAGAMESEVPWLQLQALLDRCTVCTMGIDGGGLDDLLGVSVVGKERDTGVWLTWSHAIVSPQGQEIRRINAANYDDFERDGDLTVADLPDDLVVLSNIIEMVDASGLLATVSLDPACVNDIENVCKSHGITQENSRLVGERQGVGLMKGIKTTERKLADKTMKHCGQALMTWCVGNAKVRLTSAAMLIEREASGRGKIDPLMALFDAVMGMTADPKPFVKRSVYEDRGVLVF